MDDRYEEETEDTVGGSVDDDERREHTRVKLVVEVGLNTEHKFWNGLTENISEGGLFVATESPFNIGDELMVNLKLSGRKGAQAVKCAVRWLREEAEGGMPAGMGLSFVDLSMDQASSIGLYIKTRDLDVLFWDDDFI